jgi:hypothetical protein
MGTFLSSHAAVTTHKMRNEDIEVRTGIPCGHIWRAPTIQSIKNPKPKTKRLPPKQKERGKEKLFQIEFVAF